MDDPEPCGCGRTFRVIWSPVFAEWICAECLWVKTERLLEAPVTVLPVAP